MATYPMHAPPVSLFLLKKSETGDAKDKWMLASWMWTGCIASLEFAPDGEQD